MAVNVVGKYRYRMMSPADSTWVPLIIDIILVCIGYVGVCWSVVCVVRKELFACLAPRHCCSLTAAAAA